MIGGRWKPTGVALGGGGQAQVLVVVDSFDQIPGQFAAKVLLNAGRKPRIEREINVVKRLFEVGVPVLQLLDDYLIREPDAARPWFITPIASDGSLRKHLQQGAAYGGSIEAALIFFKKILSAVEKVHQQHVAHRDLKPDNILLQAGNVVLADLGLCLPLEDLDGERLTGALERIGSLHYLPKEAFGARPLDQDQYAFDAYALGKILYELASGKQLPGFISPTEQEYDITKKQDSPLTRGINRSLRGLLHDNPAVRLATMAQLDEQLNDLLEAGSRPQNEFPEIRINLMRAADAIAGRIETRPQPIVDADIRQDLNTIRDEIFSVWSNSGSVRQIEDLVIRPYADLIELHRQPSNATLRETLCGPSITTRRSLEPIEDLKYPKFPTAEAGCAIGVKPITDSGPLPTIWLGSLVTARDGEVWIAVAVAVQVSGPNGVRDIVLGSEKVLSAGLHDATLIPKVENLATEALNRFAALLPDLLRSTK